MHDIGGLMAGVKTKGGRIAPGEHERVGPRAALIALGEGVLKEGGMPIRVEDLLTVLGVGVEAPERSVAVKVLDRFLERSAKASHGLEGWVGLEAVPRKDGERGASKKGYVLAGGWTAERAREYLERMIEDNDAEAQRKRVEAEEKKAVDKEKRPRYRGVLVDAMMRQRMRERGLDVAAFAEAHPEDCTGPWHAVAERVKAEAGE